MKILVTGGAGFIGSHVVGKYISLGHEVVIVDNLSTGRKELINPKAKFYKMDIREEGLKDVFKTEMPDVVNHHAAQIDIRKSVADPLYDADVNIMGSLRVIQNCIEYKVKKFIFASSGGAVYGEPVILPVSETHARLPLSPYGVSKLCIENYLSSINRYVDLDYVVLRYANVYGPRQDPNGEAGVCAIFIDRLLNKKPCILYGFGEPVRDYVYVKDIADVNAIVLNNGSRKTYNLGRGVGTKVLEIYNILKEIFEIKDEPERKPLRQGELEKIYLDCTKAKEELGWMAKVGMRDGLAETVRYFTHVRYRVAH